MQLILKIKINGIVFLSFKKSSYKKRNKIAVVFKCLRKYVLRNGKNTLSTLMLEEIKFYEIKNYRIIRMLEEIKL